ncbi:MAG: hypothetical protein V4642_07320 [Bacteroidota bacterium]
MLVHFDDLFIKTEEEVLKPKVIIQLDDIVLMPKIHPPLEALAIDGIPIPELKEDLIEVDIEYDRNIVFIIKKVVQ